MTKRKRRKPRGLRAEINHGIIHALTQPIETRAPWSRSDDIVRRPRSLTGSTFKGINALRLWCASYHRGFLSPYWGTEEQWERAGYSPRHWGTTTTAVVYRPVPHRSLDAPRKATVSFTIKPIHLFNADQTRRPPPSLPRARPSASMLDLIDAARLRVSYSHSIPRYCTSTDTLHMSTDVNVSHTVLLRLIARAAGAPHRLNRPTYDSVNAHAMLFESVVAEFASAYLMADLSLPSSSERCPDVARWAQLVHRNSREVFAAAAAAEKVAFYFKRLIVERDRAGGSKASLPT